MFAVDIDSQCSGCLGTIKSKGKIAGCFYQCYSCPYGVIVQGGERVYISNNVLAAVKNKDEIMVEKATEKDRELE